MAAKKKPGRPIAGKRDPKQGHKRSVATEYAQVKLYMPPETRNRVKETRKRQGFSGYADYFLAKEHLADRHGPIIREVQRKVDEFFEPIHAANQRKIDAHVQRIMSLPDDQRSTELANLSKTVSDLNEVFNAKYQHVLAFEIERALEQLANGEVTKPSDVRIASDPDELEERFAAGGRSA